MSPLWFLKCLLMKTLGGLPDTWTSLSPFPEIQWIFSFFPSRVCYERASFSPTIQTFILSAIWHGVYPGYYLTFLTGVLMTLAARTVSIAASVLFGNDSVNLQPLLMLTIKTFQLVPFKRKKGVCFTKAILGEKRSNGFITPRHRFLTESYRWHIYVQFHYTTVSEGKYMA